MKRIVQKFGGTSLANSEKRTLAVNHIQSALDSGYSPVVVVSAIGRKGAAYATDTLLNVAKEIHPDLNPREQDLIMSCGELISAVIMVQTLKKVGIKASALTGAQSGIVTDNSFTEAKIKEVNPERIIKLLKKGITPVVCGFQGMSQEGEITTLGRGASDTTASIIASAIQVLFIEIYTDVAGVMTADPLIVEDACILKELSYSEVCELGYQGARVLHPQAVEIAMKANIPIKVKSTFKESEGTLIHNNKGMRNIKENRVVTGVASRNNIIFIKIKLEKKAESVQDFKVFTLLANQGISVDFINIRPEGISFIIDAEYQKVATKLLQENSIAADINSNMLKVSVVGTGMTGRPGVLAKIVEALSQEKIAIYQTTDSHTTISCLINKEYEKKALNVLHAAFELEN